MTARPAPAAGKPSHSSPAPFVWGVSTSSYQIEGAVNVDGRGPSIWDRHCRQIGRISKGHTGDVACDHYHRYAEDVALMRELGVGAYRFSVAWPRVLPKGRGAVNEAGLAFYDRLIDALLAASIEPWLCLYHWDLPQALDDYGGWTNRDCAGWFADYAALVARRYGDRVRRFATFNESSVFTFLGYGRGADAPGIADPVALAAAIHHVNLAHGLAVDALRALAPGALIGNIHSWQPCRPASPADAAAAQCFDTYWNHAFPDPQIRAHYPPDLIPAVEPHIRSGDMARICRPIDWFGLNHYSPIYAKADPASPVDFTFGAVPPGIPQSAIGWPIEPQAFHDTLLAVHERYRLPIYVTENGIGGYDRPEATGEIADDYRVSFLTSYTEAMTAAMRAGADVRGYFVWSLLDNFEWNAGYDTRFGLVYVDYETQRRIPKRSFRWYAQKIKAALPA
jgi:beta-glucosidase